MSPTSLRPLRMVLSVLAACFAVGLVHAQPLQLVDTSPAEAAAGVALETTVVFTFDEALSLDTDHWNNAVAFPADGVEIVQSEICISAEPCGDMTGGQEPRFVRYIVRHAANLDVSWLFPWAMSETGRELETPRALFYSTRTVLASGGIAGEVAMRDVPGAAEQREHLRMLATRAQEAGIGRPVFAASEGGAKRRRAAGEGAHTRVLLLDAFSFNERFWDVRYATVVAGVAGAYGFDHVQDGTYYPVAVRYTDADAVEIEALGFYDPDGDLQADPVTVSGGLVADLTLDFYAFAPAPETAYRADADALAATLLDTPEPYAIFSGSGARPSGDAYRWSYRYASATTGDVVTIVADPLGLEVDDFPYALDPGQQPLPGSLLTAADALAVVLANGGEAFLEGLRPSNVETLAQLGNFTSRTETHVDRWFWWVQFVRRTGSDTSALTMLVDAQTGDVLEEDDATSRDGVEVPSGTRLAPNYPNPFHRETSIPFELGAPGHVRLSVFDALGREVAVVLDAPMPAGAHAVRWNAAGLPTGVYAYRLEVGSAATVRVMTLLR